LLGHVQSTFHQDLVRTYISQDDQRGKVKFYINWSKRFHSQAHKMVSLTEGWTTSVCNKTNKTKNKQTKYTITSTRNCRVSTVVLLVIMVNNGQTNHSVAQTMYKTSCKNNQHVDSRP